MSTNDEDWIAKLALVISLISLAGMSLLYCSNDDYLRDNRLEKLEEKTNHIQCYNETVVLKSIITKNHFDEGDEFGAYCVMNGFDVCGYISAGEEFHYPGGKCIPHTMVNGSITNYNCSIYKTKEVCVVN